MNSAEEVFRQRFKKMIAMAKELRVRNIEGQLAADNRYIRIGGETYRAVSLRDNHPLCGLAASGTENLDSAIMHNSNEIKDSGLLELKKERRLQCWIIREALQNKRDLLLPLGLNGKHFDKLTFALDEVSVGDNKRPINSIMKLADENGKPVNAVRCDILAVGKVGSEVRPVIIELKSSRNKKELIKQLDNFEKIMAHFEEPFVDLLEECTGESITNASPVKMIIWPALEASKGAPAKINQKTLHDLQKTVHVLEYYTEPTTYTFEAYFSVAH